MWSHPLYQHLHNNYGSLHTWHTYDIIHTLHHIQFRLYDIHHQYLGPHNHCIHDIRSIHDITSMVYDISSPISVTSQPLYPHHNTHYVCEYISTIFDREHPVKTIKPLYMTSHSSCLCLCDHSHSIDDITHALFMTSHLLYIWHNMHCIWHLTHDLWYHNTLLMTSKLLYLTSHQFYLTAHPLYICHHT